MAVVEDLRDVRVLIPRVRRALDGPHATASGSVATTLNDDELTGLIADAVANVILFTGTFFGYELEVVERDESYLAPTAWRTDKERSTEADSVIVCQAALDYFFIHFRDFKTSETIKDEGQEWSYEYSASMLRDQIKALIAARDRALEAITFEAAPLDGYVSFISERDMEAARLIEPYSPEVGQPVPYQGGAGGGFDFDPRFGTWG